MTEKQVIKIDEDTVEVDGVRYTRDQPAFKDLPVGTKIRTEEGVEAMVIKADGVRVIRTYACKALLLLTHSDGSPWYRVSGSTKNNLLSGKLGFTVLSQ